LHKARIKTYKIHIENNVPREMSSKVTKWIPDAELNSENLENEKNIYATED
jgi:hypothetical protein